MFLISVPGDLGPSLFFIRAGNCKQIGPSHWKQAARGIIKEVCTGLSKSRFQLLLFQED